MKGGWKNFWSERLFAVIQLNRLRWEINGHDGIGCGEGSEFRTTRFSHD